MTGEQSFRDRHRVDGGGRFKDRTVLVAFGLLALVLLVFGAGMAAASFQSDDGRPDWGRESGSSRRAESLYNPGGR